MGAAEVGHGALQLAPACRAAADAGLCGPGAAQGHRPAHVSSAHIWWFVSDLHLGAGPDHRGTAAALVEFLGVVADTRRRPTAASCCSATASTCRPTTARRPRWRRHRAPAPRGRSPPCGGHGAPGWTSRWCAATTTPRWPARPCGRPSSSCCQSRRPATAGPAPARGAVQVHPWWLHEPHVFHAEHGHQHHDVHRLPTLLEQTVSSPPARVTPDGLVRDGRRRTDPAAGRRDAGGRGDRARGAEGGRGAIPGTGRRGGIARRAPRRPRLARWRAPRGFALCPPRWA